MAIDSSALTSIKNAIASYSGSESTYSDKLKNDANNSVNSLAQKASSFATKSRYKAAFEEKMKIANESSDTVEISKESLAALKKYNQTEVSAAAKKDSSSSSGYTYDYQSIKKKNLENIAAIEKEVSEYTQQLANTESEYTTFIRSTGSEKPYVDLYYNKTAFPTFLAKISWNRSASVFGLFLGYILIPPVF